MEAACKQCPKCKTEVFQGAFSCIRCGSRLEGRAPLPSSVRLKAAEQTPVRGRQVTYTYTGYSLTMPRTKAR
ncbi:MAG TPA: hypothetical protein VFV94_16290 [Polyangiaceae bacterium]|nr:hypothetical protein [Polyangiaceae bacterium]